MDRQVVVAATPARLEDLHALLERFWAGVDQAVPAPPEPICRLPFATAVVEIAANIVRHAYPAGAEPGRLRLRLRAFPDRIEARFTDCGLPFAPQPPIDLGPATPATGAGPGLDPLDDVSLVAEGGYGLRIARAAVDELDYARTRGGRNAWRLVKWFPPQRVGRPAITGGGGWSRAGRGT